MDVSELPARLAARLERGRAMARARMAAASRATVRREVGKAPQGDSDGLEVPLWDVVLADSLFLLKGTLGTSASRTLTVGGVEVTLGVREGQFPTFQDDGARTPRLRDGDLIDVTEGENAGTAWRVVEGDWADQQTAYRVPIVATARPEEWA